MPLLLAAAPAPIPPKGQPPLTEVTQRSGGPIEPARAAQKLEHVDLALEVLPKTQSFTGVATLTLSATAPLDRVQLDLDRDLAVAVAAVALDGIPQPRTTWANPQGRLSVTRPRRLPAGARTIVRIAYAGTAPARSPSRPARMSSLIRTRA